MRLLEIKGIEGTRRFINPALITKLVIKETGQIEVDVLGGGFEVVEKGSLGYQDLMNIMKITHSPASGTSQLE